MKTPDEKTRKEFEKWGEPAPAHDEHGEDTWEHPVSEKLVPAKCWNWHMEGNQLKCDTDLGPLSQTIPTGYICLGTDENNLPILKELIL